MSKVSPFNGNGATFVPGKIYGLRSFELSKYGTLASITADGSWSTTEKAYCAKKKHKNQPAPQRKCSCGLYGYFTPENDEFYAPAYVSAVFEAHGNIIIGNRGFRAEKARLLAYALPESERVKRHAKLTAWKMVTLFILSSLALSVSRYVTDYQLLQFVFFAFLGYLNVTALFRGLRTFISYHLSKWNDDTAIVELKKNYPGVEVFSSRQELIQAYSTHLSQSQELANAVTKQKTGFNNTFEFLGKARTKHKHRDK